VKHPNHPNAVYVGEFHGYKCWVEPDAEYLAQLKQEAKEPGCNPGSGESPSEEDVCQEAV
jgi:hypothetical protein